MSCGSSLRKMRVLILRPEHQLGQTLEKLRNEGFEAFGCPFIKIEYLDFHVPEHEYAIVTSQNAARVVVERGIKLEKVVAIGKKTAEVLRRAGYNVETPSQYDSSTLVREFMNTLKGKRVVAIRSDAGSDELTKLSEVSDFSEITAYRIIKLKGEKQREAVKNAAEGFYDVIVFSSSLIARNFIELCHEMEIKNILAKAVAIGPPTAKILRNFGINPLMPDEYTFDGIVRLLKHLESCISNQD